MKLLLVGCGKMGSALLTRWQTTAIGRIDIVTPHPSQPNNGHITWHTSSDSLRNNYTPDVIVLAVKPQQFEAVLPVYRQRFGSKPLYVSVAAGKTLTFLHHHLGDDARIIRTMPNLPVMIGEGMTTLCGGKHITAADKAMMATLVQPLGRAEWIEESLMDAATAIAGCGPAYVFLFIEAMARAGQVVGLTEDKAKTLAAQTVLGSAALASQNPASLAELRSRIASPGGTTEAALGVLMQGGTLEKMMKEAVLAAVNRAKEL